ncbi:MAG: hypothetical protein JO349_00885 [Candidatus Eremiobacteraeota bacterium]|nr:hypothetical protein [Candidatus Eremiobacteraeota bacterium]
MRTGPRVTWEQSEYSSPETDSSEYARAATAYLAWPLALFELVRGSAGSLWYRAHVRQATILGALLWTGLFALLALPLVLVLALGGPPVGETIAIYAVALVIDVAYFVAAMVVVIQSALRASRGELFMLPVISSLSERLFARRRG